MNAHDTDGWTYQMVHLWSSDTGQWSAGPDIAAVVAVRLAAAATAHAGQAGYDLISDHTNTDTHTPTDSKHLLRH